MTTMNHTEHCEFPGCNRELRGNPNDHQCNDCCRVFCSTHQRMVGIERLCVRCSPPRRRRRSASRHSTGFVGYR
jgi:hypothetical protein